MELGCTGHMAHVGNVWHAERQTWDFETEVAKSMQDAGLALRCAVSEWGGFGVGGLPPPK